MMDSSELSDLLSKYAEPVYNIAYRICGSPEDAEEITQDTFLKIYRGYDSFRGESDIFTWIYRIAVHNSLRYKSRISRQTFQSLDEEIKLYADTLPEEVREWDTIPDKKYLMDELLLEISRECTYFMTFKLTEEQRLVYILRTILNLTYDQIALILEIPISTVKARLSRARNNLVRYFTPQCRRLNPESTCSCRLKVGFTIHMVPDILNRVKKHATEDSDRYIAQNLKKIPALNDSFIDLPLFDYQVKAVEYYMDRIIDG